MKLEHFHFHLEQFDCEFCHITNDFRHSVYKNKKNKRRATFLKDPILKPDNIELCCVHLGIPVPNDISKILERS